MLITTTITTEETPQIAKILQNAIEEIKQISQEVKVEYTNQDAIYKPSEADKKDLQEILALREKGELEYISHEEFKEHKQELFARLGANAN
ncbi:MAG: hypothetical protein MR902_07355 [Campylobacter sp.]|nr:hypothetical protein [Campylobacter sp.]